MKKQMLVIWTAIIVVLLSVGSIVAQDGKKNHYNCRPNHQHLFFHFYLLYVFL